MIRLIANPGNCGDDDDKSVLFSHAQRLAQGDEDYGKLRTYYFWNLFSQALQVKLAIVV